VTISLARLPDAIATGALVTFTFDTAKNTSEGGVSGRKAMRTHVVRNYMVSVPLAADAAEFQNIVLSCLGQRYPFALRDPTAYTLSNEPQSDADYTTVGGTTHVKLYKTFQPSTGALAYRQRILVPDARDVPMVFSLNGTTVAATIVDPGIAVIGSVLSGTDDLRIVSGQYLVPVCLVDMPAATIQRGPLTNILYTFDNVRMEEILENELVALTS
jgi:hypothetical protein